MKLEIYGDGKHTRTIVDAEQKIFVVLTPELIKRIELLERVLYHISPFDKKYHEILADNSYDKDKK